MKSDKYSQIGNLFLIVYGILLFIRITMMDASERDEFDIFQWILGPVIVILSGYRAVGQLKKKKEKE